MESTRVLFLRSGAIPSKLEDYVWSGMVSSSRRRCELSEKDGKLEGYRSIDRPNKVANTSRDSTSKSEADSSNIVKLSEQGPSRISAEQPRILAKQLGQGKPNKPD